MQKPHSYKLNILVKKRREFYMLATNISNAAIEEIFQEQNDTFVTVSYMTGFKTRQTVRLVVNPRTIILNTNGIPVPATALRIGMTINASISSAMTRSIPPQTTAFEIQIL